MLLWRVLRLFNVVFQTSVIGVSVFWKKISMLSLNKSLRLFGVLQVKISCQVKDAVVPRVGSHIVGRRPCTDICSLSVAESHICSALIVPTELSVTGIFRST